MSGRIRSLLFFIYLQLTASCLYGQLRVDSILVPEKTFYYKPAVPLQFAALTNDITFIFSSGNSSAARRNRYKLHGFDKDWISALYPVARYTNLNGGAYQLEIQELSGSRIIGHLKVPFTIERELTEEWWFIPSVIGYVLALLGTLMYFFILYNFRQKLKVQAIRYRIAADLHDEVGATLSSIAMATNMVQHKVSDSMTDVQTLLAHIKSDSEETILTIRDTVWTINPDNDSSERLFEKMRSLAFQMLTLQHIKLHFESNIKADKGLKINMEQRRNLYLIFKEAINNIARHSGATEARILITHTKDGLSWLIEDNGVGFDTALPAEGNGLKNFRSRAAESLIDLTIESAPGKGTQLLMVVPEL